MGSGWYGGPVGLGLGRLGTGWLPMSGLGRLRLDRMGWMGVD